MASRVMAGFSRGRVVEEALAAGMLVAALAMGAGVLAVGSGLAVEEARRAWRHAQRTPDPGEIPAERHRQTRSAAAR